MNLSCVNADHGFCTKPTGHVMPCCISSERVVNNSGEVAILNKDQATDIWQSRYLIDLRRDLQNGIQHPNCSQCWSEEAAGYKSKRLRDNERWVDLVNEPTGELPKLLDLSLGNTCNLACRTCGTFASSRWYKETQRQLLPSVKRNELKQLNDQIQDSYADTASIWPFLDKALPNVLHIDLYGGEPLLVKRHWQMLNAIPEDIASNISLHFNTNGTQWDDDYAEILCRFKAVTADISIDGIGPVFEYMRWPAKWDQVNANIQNFKNLSVQHPQISVGICITLSIMNTWSLPETIEYTQQMELSCYLNLLHSPNEMSLKNLSPAAAELLIEHLKVVSHDQIDSIKSFIGSNRSGQTMSRALLDMLNEHDLLRNQSFKRLSPELYQVLHHV